MLKVACLSPVYRAIEVHAQHLHCKIIVHLMHYYTLIYTYVLVILSGLIPTCTTAALSASVFFFQLRLVPVVAPLRMWSTVNQHGMSRIASVSDFHYYKK